MQSEADDPLIAVTFDIVDQFERDLEAGKSFGLDHYLERFPGHEAVVRQEFARLRQTEPDEPRPPRSPIGRRLGPYEIVRELGRGGQGAVYLAGDSRFDREVALKVLPPAAFVSQARLTRFRREADVVASLSHPAICDVIDADFGGDVAYIAMRFVPGQSLAAATRDGGDPDRRAVRRSIALIERVARAVHVAHQAGVVHRDIKPDNVMVTPTGDPVLLDFGLAKGLDDATLTEPGAAFGTLHYMAPEQLLEHPPPIDRRADIWALAATLYELVAGRRPFEAATREGLVTQIRTVQPKDAGTLNSAVPADLSVVLLKALEKDPRRRYETALDFAEDLRRVLAYEPILARPASPLIRVGRWAQRHPLLSTSVTLTVLLLAAGLIVSLVLLGHVKAERDRHRALSLATYALTLAERDPTFALLTAIEASRIERTQTANTALYRALLASHEERVLGMELLFARGMVAVAPSARLLAFANGHACRIRTLTGGEHEIESAATLLCAAFDPSGEHIALGCDDGSVRVHDALTGDLVAALPARAIAETRLAFSPDGRRLVSCADDGTSRVLDRISGEVIGPLGRGVAPQYRVAIDGDTVVMLDRDGVLTAFDLSREQTAWARGEDDPVRVLEAAGDGHLLAFATEHEVFLAEITTGRVLQRLPGERVVQSLAFDGRRERLAVGHEGALRIWSTTGGQLLVDRPAHDRRAVWDVAFSPDGRQLATAGVDGTARVFDAASGAPTAVFPMTEPHVTHVYWTPDAGRVIVVCRDNAVSINSLADREGLLTLRGHAGGVLEASFSPDGERVLTASDDGTARIFAVDGTPTATFVHGAPVSAARWSPRANQVLTIAADGVRVFAAAHPEQGRDLASGRCVAAEWIDAERVLIVWTDGRITVHEAASGQPLHTARVDRAVRCAVLLLDRRRVALGHETPHVSVVDLEGATPPTTITLTSKHARVPSPAVMNIAVVAGRDLLLAGVEDIHLRLLALDPLAELHAVPVSTPAFTIASRQGTLALTGAAYNPRCYLHDIHRDAVQRRAVFIDHGNRLTHGGFSPDGELLVTASYDGTVRLYHTDESGGYAVLAGHTDVVTHAEFSPDGTRLVTASLDHTIRIWPTDPLPLALRRQPRSFTAPERDILAGRGITVR